MGDPIADFNAQVIAKIEAFVGVVKKDLGVFAHALYANVQHDVHVAGGAALTVAKDDFENMWSTAKAQIAQEGKSLLATFEKDGFEAAVGDAHALLSNIDWKSVGTSLEGVGLTTLGTFARTLLPMLLSGVIAAL